MASGIVPLSRFFHSETRVPGHDSLGHVFLSFLRLGWKHEPLRGVDWGFIRRHSGIGQRSRALGSYRSAFAPGFASH